MYMRCHPIITAFQKTAILKGSTSNSLLYSDSNVIFSKFENPLRRYFSGGPFQRYLKGDVTRYIQPTGFKRKNFQAVYPNKEGVPSEIPKREIHPRNNQIEVQKNDCVNVPATPNQFGNTQEIVNFPLSTNLDNKPTGTVTIVIDKADILSDANSSENITIRVTNTPKISSKRLIEGLSDIEVAKICNTRCSCCQRCAELRRISSSQSLNFKNPVIGPKLQGCISNITVVTPKRLQNPPIFIQQSPYIPSRNYSIGGFSSVITDLPKVQIGSVPSTIVSAYQGLPQTKLVAPKNFNEPQKQLKIPKVIERNPHEIAGRQYTQKKLIPRKNVSSMPMGMAKRMPEPYQRKGLNSQFNKTISQNLPAHPKYIIQKERTLKNARGLQPIVLERSRQMERNRLPNKASSQGPHRNFVPQNRTSGMFRFSSVDTRFTHRLQPLTEQPLKTNFVLLPNNMNKNRNPFTSPVGKGYGKKLIGSSSSLDLTKNRFKSNNTRRNLSVQQVAKNSSVRLESQIPLGNQKNRLIQPRSTNFQQNCSPSSVPLRRKASIVSQHAVQPRNKFADRNRIPKMIVIPSNASKQLPNKLQVRSAPVLARPGISLGRAPQTKNNLQRTMPSNKNVKSVATKEPPKNFKQIRPSPNLNTHRALLGPASQAKGIFQRNTTFINNLKNSTSKQPPNNSNQMRTAPLYRLGVALGPSSQSQTLGKNVKNLTGKQHPNNIKQMRPAPTLSRVRTSLGLAQKTKNIFQQNVNLNKNLKNLTNNQPLNKSSQMRPVPPLHRLGTSRGPVTQTKNIFQRNVSSNNFLKNSSNNKSRQMRPAPPFHRLGTSRGLVVQTRNIFQRNANFNNFLKNSSNKSNQMRPVPPLHRLGTSRGLVTQTKNIFQRNVSLNKNLKNSTNKQALNKYKRPTPPLHRLGSSRGPRPQPNNIRQKYVPLRYLQNLTSQQLTNNLKQKRQTPPFHRLNTSFGQIQKNILQQNMHFNKNLKNIIRMEPRSNNMCPTPTMHASSFHPMTSTQRNMEQNKNYNNLPRKLPPYNMKQVRSFPPPLHGNSLNSPPQMRNIPQPKIGDCSKVLPPPGQRIQRVQNQKFIQKNTQSSLPVRLINVPKPSVEYLGKPKFPQSNGKQPSNPSMSDKGLQVENEPRNPAINNPSQRIGLRSQLRTKAPRRPIVPKDNFNHIPARGQSMVASDKKIPNPNEIDISVGNPAVLLYAPRKLKLVKTPIPRLTDDKGVIIKMLYVHLTDTDAQMYASGKNGHTKLTKPTLAGKNGCGVVVDVGQGVKNVKPGDQVFIKTLSCGKCSPCKNGHLRLCKSIPMDEKFGLLTRFHAHPAEFVEKLPDNVNPISGSLIDDLSLAISACKKSAITAGDNVMVLDGGSLGLCTALTAKSMGATNVCLADSRKSVLEQAKKLGIDSVFLIDPKSPVSLTSKKMYEYLDGENPRIVYNCNGSQLTSQIAIHATKFGGKVVLMKNDCSDQPIPISDALNRGIDILTSQQSDSDSEQAALQFLSTGKVQLDRVNSQIYDLSKVHEAFEVLLAPKRTIFHVFVRCNELDEKKDSKKSSSNS